MRKWRKEIEKGKNSETNEKDIRLSDSRKLDSDAKKDIEREEKTEQSASSTECNSQTLTDNYKIQQTAVPSEKLKKANAVYRMQRWRMRVKLRSREGSSRLKISETNQNIDIIGGKIQIVPGNQNEDVENNQMRM